MVFLDAYGASWLPDALLPPTFAAAPLFPRALLLNNTNTVSCIPRTHGSPSSGKCTLLPAGWTLGLDSEQQAQEHDRHTARRCGACVGC